MIHVIAQKSSWECHAEQEPPPPMLFTFKFSQLIFSVLYTSTVVVKSEDSNPFDNRTY